MKLIKPLFFIASIMLTLAVGVALGQRLYKTHRGGPAFADSTPLNLTAAPASAAGGMMNYADVAERVNHAVVAITSTEFKEAPRPGAGGMQGIPFPFFNFGPRGPQRRQPAPGGEGDGGDDENQQRSVSGGSGFIITPDGYILTNHHVIDNASKIEVQLENDKKYPARLIGSDKETDLALLKIDGHDLPTLTLGDSDRARVGEWVLAIGNPLIFSHTVTVGVLSAKGRKLDTGLGSFLQTDAAINFGNSGGPLINGRGEVIGINDAIIRNDEAGRTIEGIGFAIPVNTAKQIVDELKNRGKVARGYLGVQVGPLTDDAKNYQQRKYNLKLEGGALINSVEKDTPAAAEGMQSGDIIVEADGQPVKDSEALVRIIAGRKPGEKVKLGFYRKGERKNAAVALADRAKRMNNDSAPDEESSPAPRKNSSEKRLGFKVEELDSDARHELQLPDGLKGVVVSSVSPRSNAYEAGLRRGWVITAFNDEAVKNFDAFEAAAKSVKAGDPINLVATRGDSQRVFFFDAQPDDAPKK